jgi:hypothetical protein
MTDDYERVAVSVVIAAALLVTLGALGTFASRSNSVSIPTNLVWVGDVSYNTDNVSVTLPPPICDPTGPPGNQTSYSFHGVLFTLWISDWCSPGGGLLNGTIRESNGTTFEFAIPGLPGPAQYATWISPDHSCGVEWDRVVFVTAILLVRT